jgi:hypothetical protein
LLKLVADRSASVWSRIGVSAAAAAAALTFVPAASALPSPTVSSFTYAQGSSPQALTVQATNTGSNELQVFAFELTATTTLKNVALTVGGVSHSGVCAAHNGGWPAIQCNFPAGLIPAGTAFTVTFTASPAYPAGSQNLWFADDATGANSGEFDGPILYTPPPPPDPTPAPTPDPTPTPTPDPTPSPTPDPTPAPTPDPTPSPTPDPTPAPTPDPTPTPTPDPTPAPTPDPSPAPDNSAPLPAVTPAPVVPSQTGSTCSVTGSCTDDGTPPASVHQTTGNRACRSGAFSLKPDPAMMNRRGVRGSQHAFGMALMWTMSVTGGSGGCRGTLSFGSPVVQMGSTAVPKRELSLNARTVSFSCSGPCTKSMAGRVKIKMLSRKQLKMLFGHTLIYRLALTSGGQTHTQTVRVFVDAHGMLRKSH